MSEKKRFPWVWVGAGCGCLVLAAIVVVAALGSWFFESARDFTTNIKDPVKRAERSQEVLGYERLPEGYVPTFGLSVPLIGDVGLLTDVGLTDQGELEGPVTRGFFYARLSKLMARDREIRDILDGKSDPSAIFESANLRVETGEILDEGELVIGGQPVRYSAYRGDMEVEKDDLSGVLAMIFVKCERGRPGVGAWFTEDPTGGVPAGEADFTGTPADPVALASFLSGFRLCDG